MTADIRIWDENIDQWIKVDRGGNGRILIGFQDEESKKDDVYLSLGFFSYRDAVLLARIILHIAEERA